MSLKATLTEMDEFGVKMSAITVNVITLPYFMNQKSVQKKAVATSLPLQANLLSKDKAFISKEMKNKSNCTCSVNYFS